MVLHQEDPDRVSPAAYVLMALVLLWSGGLAVGFAYAAAAGEGSLTGTRRLAYALVAGFLALLSVRTGYELVRRLRLRRRRQDRAS